MSKSHTHLISDPEQIHKFVLAGRAIFTVKNTETGNRLTFKVSRKLDDDGNPTGPWFVGVLNGPDNNSSYGYLGCIWADGRYVHGRKSRIASDSRSNKVFEWFWSRTVHKVALPEKVEFWHEGRCGCCGRLLTVPKSIETGIGPICETTLRGRAMAAAAKDDDEAKMQAAEAKADREQTRRDEEAKAAARA